MIFCPAHLTYCDIVWHLYKSSDETKMERIQFKSALLGQSLNPNRKPKVSFLLTRAGLPSLYQQQLQNIAIFMYKVKKQTCALLYNRAIQHYPETVYNLRNADINIPCFRIVHYGKHSLRYLFPHPWNKFDKTQREKPNVKSFKNKNSIRSKDLSHLVDNCKNCDIRC